MHRAEGPSRPADAMKGVGSLGRISIRGICRNATDTEIKIYSDEAGLWRDPDEQRHKITIRFLGGCCKYLPGPCSDQCKEEETGVEVAVTSTTGSSNEVLVGSSHPESQSNEKVDINFQIFSKRILPKATIPKAENGWRVRTKNNEPLKLGLTREPLEWEKKSKQEERNSAFPRGGNRVKT